METITELQSFLNLELSKQNINRSPANIYQPIKYVLDLGGKRIRAVLCLASAEMFSGNYKNAIQAAIGLEIFHNFTLLHDDIMDNANMRRGKPTVHTKWNENIALLSGDAMSIMAYKYISKTPVNMNACMDVFNDTAIKICEGQQFDMDFENLDDVSIEDYFNMIHLKTAVFLACSLKIGAIIGNANKEDSDNMYKTGQQIGMAFQLQDDLLDVYGDSNKFGKQIGGDILANKKTFLLLKAFQLSNKKQKEDLNYWINIQNYNAEDKINAVTAIFNRLKIKEITTSLIDNYLQKGSDSLNKVEIEHSKKEIIFSFIATIRNRSH